MNTTKAEMPNKKGANKMTKRELARETKQLANNENSRLQVTKCGRGYNAYLTYTNEWFQDAEDEKTLGFIDYPMTLKQVEEWLYNVEYNGGMR